MVTDGEKHERRSPDQSPARIFRKSEAALGLFRGVRYGSGEVAFLKASGATSSERERASSFARRLDGIFHGKILAEAPGAGDRDPEEVTSCTLVAETIIAMLAKGIP